MSVLETEDRKEYCSTESNAVYAVNNVNFAVKQGEFVFMAEISGSGKSTQLNGMDGLDSLTLGWARSFNKNGKMNGKQLAEYIVKTEDIKIVGWGGDKV